MPQRPGAGRKPGLRTDGPEIKRLRVRLGLTTEQLGAQTGHHAESIRRAQKGGPISDVFASRLARALGVSMRDITEGESEPEPDRLSA
jgi:transcriptional regulator with XRE-family HTH domain